MSDAQVPSWVTLYDDDDYTDRNLTKLYPDNVKNMNDVKSNDGKGGFNDKASSAIYCIAVGLTCRLYEDDSYNGSYYDLKGTGEKEKVNLKNQNFNDKTSSLKWKD
jgi:hypothetical protein